MNHSDGDMPNKENFVGCQYSHEIYISFNNYIQNESILIYKCMTYSVILVKINPFQIRKSITALFLIIIFFYFSYK